MCDDRHEGERRRQEDKEDCGCRDWREGRLEGHDHHGECRLDGDPLDFVEETLYEIASDAYVELLHERVKALLQEKWGARIDETARLFVEHYVRARDAQMDAAREAEDLHLKLHQLFKKA